MTEEITVIIEKIPFEICEQELLWELEKHIYINENQIIHFLPFKDYNKAEIICTQDDYQSLIRSVPHNWTNDFKSIEIKRGSTCNDYKADDRLQNLPREILYTICESCSIVDQMNLAKTCTQFYEFIATLWRNKFSTQWFTYNYHDFMYVLNWDDGTIRELCTMVGKHIRKVRFVTYINMNLLNELSQSSIGNPMENIKYFINNNFRSNIKHFNNLLQLEIWGNFLLDCVIADLVVYCKQIKSINLFDSINLWFKGFHLNQLENLETLGLKGCQNVEFNHILLTSVNCQLNELNIVQCDKLLTNVQDIIQCTNHWQFLNTLKISAFTSERSLIKALLNLPVLQNLQFFWINFLPTQFEENLLKELHENEEKRLKLIRLNYENDCLNIQNEGLQEWTPLKYETMRENVCIWGEPWHCSNELFDIYLTLFGSFLQLSEINFNYCRLFGYEQLKTLPLLNSNLQLIKIRGCPQRDDEKFYKEWYENVRTGNHQCQLKFVNFLSYADVTKLQSQAEERQFSSYYRLDPVVRSIECCFEE